MSVTFLKPRVAALSAQQRLVVQNARLTTGDVLNQWSYTTRCAPHVDAQPCRFVTGLFT